MPFWYGPVLTNVNKCEKYGSDSNLRKEHRELR
jgi:hypothetical protein